MAILAQCPRCRRTQALKHKVCKCGEDLVKAKRSQRVRYWVVYRKNGKQKWINIDSVEGCSAKSLQDARAVESKYKVSKKERKVFDIEPKGEMTFKALTEWYLEKVFPVDVQRKGLKDEKSLPATLNAVNKNFGDKRVSEIAARDLMSYQAMLKKKGRADATIDHHVKAIKQVLTEGVMSGLVSGDVLRELKRIKDLLKVGRNARTRTLSLKEYMALLDVAKFHLKAMLIIAMHAGMREGEIRELQWSHVDWENDLIRLPEEMTKEKRSKLIPMNHHVRDLLEILHKQGHEYVITYKGQPISARAGIRRTLTTACTKTKIITYGSKVENGFTFRDIRTTVKTNMLEAGVSKEYRDLILGHSFTGMDRYYLKPQVDRLKRAMDKYTEWFDRQLQVLGKPLDTEESRGEQVKTSN